jgi:hypothetical protein
MHRSGERKFWSERPCDARFQTHGFAVKEPTMRTIQARWRLMILAGCVVAATAARAEAQKAGFVLLPDAPQLSLSPDASVADAAAAVTPEQQFVQPVSDPYLNYDSFIFTDLRMEYAYETFASHGALGGGDAQVIAPQLNVAITPQLQLMAYKDGYSIIRSGALKGDGWNDIGAGLKWQFFQDYRDQLFAAVGVGYEFPTGESKALGNKESFQVWASVDKGIGALHLGGTVNYQQGDGEQGLFGTGENLAVHVHGDYFITNWVSFVGEGNYYHQLRDRNSVLPIQGGDLALLGGGHRR